MIKTSQNTILFPTDFSEVSEHALDFVMNYCQKAKAKLIILSIVDMPFSDTTEDEKPEIDLLVNDLINLSNAKLAEMKVDLSSKTTIEIETATYTGEATLAICRAVSNFGVKLIIMGTRPSKELYFKYNSFNIVKSALVPLLTVGIDAPVNDIKTILFPFNEKTITLKKSDEVIELAKTLQAKVAFLGVSEANTPEKVNNITNDMMHVKTLFDEQNIVTDIHFSASNNYSESILDFCNNNGIDLVAIVNDHSNLLKGALTLNTTKKLIKNAHVPVLTVPVWKQI